MREQERLAGRAEELGYTALWTRDVPLRDLSSPLRVVRVEFQWAIAAAPAPELICELAIGTVSGAGGR